MTHSLTVVTDYNPGGHNETETVWFKRSHHCWEVRGPGENQYESFADSDASREDVEQLLRKEYDCRY
jgi:hypothetical protein